MNTPDPTPQNPNPQPPEIAQEVRFAVVMYGGVSLAIYINGVAQQLLDMVRATAVVPPPGTGTGPGTGAAQSPTPAPPPPGLHYADEELTAAGRIYRRIAKFLGSRAHDDAILETDDPSAPVRTKFVVDVISGTSAGGLNGIFLGKALANDQSMVSLQDLWMKEGDLERLLNDGESVKNEPALQPEKVETPQSLLNSERMYEKLLTALHVMDFPGGNHATGVLARPKAAARSPLVEELDVFVTTTDLTGLPIRIQLANAVAEEKRHRNVFSFRYSTPDSTGEWRNDFTDACNPFLAFAGRCTSSFPFAFEPMQLRDIWPVLGAWERYRGNEKDKATEWMHRFCRDYLDAGCDGDFAFRPFGDGGYLDNKPFTYATRALMRRHASLPVVRKLLYVEPSPETLGRAACSEKKPNVLANVTAALVSLPGYETIREDLQAVIERNKLLEEVAKLTAKLDEDIGGSTVLSKAGKDYRKTPLADLLPQYGVSYGIYHRLKIDVVTMTLAHTITRAIGFDTESDDCRALRLIFEAWRERNYREKPSEIIAGSGAEFDTAFLLDFDLEYRIRRLYFIAKRINRLAREQDRADVRADLAPFVARPDFQQALRDLKAVVSAALLRLRIKLRTLHQDTTLVGLIHKIVGDPATTTEARTRLQRVSLDVLSDPTNATARRIAGNLADEIRAIAEYIAGKLRETFEEIGRDLVPKLLTPPAAATLFSAGERAARAEIAQLYHNFEWYDMVIFPIEHGTDAAETNRVDIVRISPLDSPNLIPGMGPGRAKLAGTALWAFGAFLDRAWRENDMLWGKLDAAEIIIRNLLAGDPRARPETVTTLVDRMHRAILNESLTPDMRNEMYRLICDAVTRDPRGMCREASVRQIIARLGDLDERLKKVLRCCLDEEELLEYFKVNYQVNPDLDPKHTLRLAGRAAKVVGKMAATLGERTLVSMQAKFFARLTSGLWAIVEISVPRSFAWNEARHLRALLYLVGGVLLLLGALWHPALAPGFVILAATFVLHVITVWLHGIMDGGKNIGRWILIGLAVATVALAGWGTIDLVNRFQRWANKSAPASVTP